jgi:ABC-type uncharacterized transport system substrate-binding protein
MRSFAGELVQLRPDVIFACTTPVTAALHRETHTIPIVFALVGDPVGDGFVASLARPGGNLTGFINVEAGMVSKLLQLLKEIAPHIKRVAIMLNPDTAPGGGDYYQGSFEAAARMLAVEPATLHVRSDGEIDTAMTSLSRQQSGVVLMPDAFVATHLQAINRQRLATTCQRSSICPNLLKRGAWSHTGQTRQTCSGARLAMWIAPYAGPSPRTCRSRSRQSTT